LRRICWLYLGLSALGGAFAGALIFLLVLMYGL
jgi:hypothetical protein